MKHCHKTIKHLRGNSFIDSLVLLEVHMFWSASTSAVVKDIISELLYLLLVTYPIFIINILALIILVHALPFLLSLLPCQITRRLQPAARAYIIHAFVLEYLLDCI